jgi:dolichyl-phosphate beta-glucosyltransferase
VSQPPAPLAAPDLSIVIPAYNEEKRLPSTLDRIAEYLHEQTFSFEVIIVDDGSRDETSRVASEFCASHPWARLLRYEDEGGKAVNRGKGFAVRTGMLATVGRNVLFSDADLSTPIEEMEKLLPLIESGKCDIAIASRAMPGSNLTVHQPWYREAMGRAFNLLVRIAIRTRVRDTQCGFKALNGTSAKRIFKLCHLDGFGFDAEMIFLASRFKLRVREIAVTWHHAEDSRVNPLVAPLQMMRELVEIRVNEARGKYKEHK